MVGDQILIRGYEDGKRFSNREIYKPTMFVSSNVKTKYKTLTGDYVEPVKPGTIKETREFISKYEGVDGFKIFGFERFIYQFISDNYPEDQIEFDISKIKLITIDIETMSENGFPDVESTSEEILLVTIQDYTTKEIITWGTRPFTNTHDNVDYRLCNDEHHLLSSFIQWWIENTPDVVTGWNCEFFDIPYIAGRLNRVLGSKLMKRLSPWGLVTQSDVVVRGRKNFIVDIGGVSVLDYMRLYRWSPGTPNQESFRLDYIAQQELGQKKLDHSEFDTFKDFYTKGWQKFVEYNIIDVQLVDRFEDKLKLIELALTMAYDAKVNYQDIFFQVRLWDCIIYNELKRRNIAIPQKVGSKKDEKYAGAYVKEPIPGKYDWVVSFDLNSLYPHLIMQYNISPETLIEQRHPTATVDKILAEDINFELYKDNAICANGAMYRKDKRGFLPELMQKYYDERVIYKKRMIKAKKAYEKTPSKSLEKEIARCNNIQMAKKISLNSAYGAIGNQYFRYYKLENAEAITLSGQVSIRWIENKMNQKINHILKTKDVDYVIASDTDSIYLNLGPLVEVIYKEREKNVASIVSFLDKICEMEFELYIESSYKALASYVNAYDQKMFMKRENIADRGIWTAKKRYILNVWDSEGVRYSEPKLKIMGIEAVKSSTPAPCRKAIKDALAVMMSGTEDEMIDFIDQFRKTFKSLPPEEISFPRTVSDVVKYKGRNAIYEKGTPIHARGSLLFNHHVKRLGLEGKYSLIGNGEKVKFCYLRSPNPIHENVMSFIQDFPREIGLEKYIDYDLQFEKSFLDPLKIILDVIQWNVERTSSLESFFT
tara:strand:- start:518 stop:2992 length:2475 start_codon:yes stop_codon:yes gene_type:complete